MSKREVFAVSAGVMGVCGLTLFVTVQAQRGPSQAERQIRSQIEAFDTRSNVAEEGYTSNAVIWTGAYSKPMTLDAPHPADIPAPGRRNSVQKVNPTRIVVAPAGDMAYEYSSFHLSYDDDRGHSNIDGALLRVWQLQNNKWMVVAHFQRPYGRVVPVEAQK
jgi:hypothetical protein